MLAGALYARKDCFARQDKLMECGSGIREGRLAATTSPIISALDSMGAIDMGRLHMSELAMSPMGRNDYLGAGRNPWDPSRVSGGSSSGSAIAVAQRLVHFSLGTDTGGSVRLPAAACGVSGFKPTNGILSTDQVMPLAPSLDAVGILAPRAEEISIVFRNLAAGNQVGHADSAGSAGAKTVVAPVLEPGPLSDESVVSSFEGTIDVLKGLGLNVQRTTAPDLGILNQAAMLIMGAEGAACFESDLRKHAGRFNPEIRRRLERGLLCPATVYYRALRARPRLLAEFLSSLIPADAVLLLPTLPYEAPLIEENTTGTAVQREERFANFSYWARPVNYLGLPAISVPMGFGPNGLPLGAQFIGRPFQDYKILEIARLYQNVTSWHESTPQETPLTAVSLASQSKVKFC